MSYSLLKWSTFSVFSGRMVADQDNPLTLDILSASSTAYSYYPDNAITEVNTQL